VASILKYQGELIGLFWKHTKPGSLPFAVTLAEIKQYF
jgi:hypothetical protein